MQDAGTATLPLAADFHPMQMSTVMQENKMKQTKKERETKLTYSVTQLKL